MQQIGEESGYNAFKKSISDMTKCLKEVSALYKEHINETNIKTEFDDILSNSDEEKILVKLESFYNEIQRRLSQRNKGIEFQKQAIVAGNEVVKILEKLTKENKQNIEEYESFVNVLVDTTIKKEKEHQQKVIEQTEEKFKQRIEELRNRINEKEEVIQIDETHKEINIIQEIDECPKEFCSSKQLEQVGKVFHYLQEWSGLTKFKIIFDSDIDGDGKGALEKVLFKKNVYFISFDCEGAGEGNVYGGYVETTINRTEDYITDPHAFVFSLIRNGKANPQRYFIKEGEEGKAFWLYTNSIRLYKFGYDVGVFKLGSGRSCCNQCYYEYNGVEKALTDIQYDNRFIVKRIVILQMLE